MTRVWLGPRQGCARIENGTFACWGDESPSRAAVVKAFHPKPKELFFGVASSCALAEGGGLSCGQGNVDMPFVGDVHPTTLTIGKGHTCAADTSKGVVLQCWGRNEEGQLGGPRGTEGTMPPAGLTVGAGDLHGLAAGDAHTCVAVTRSVGDGRDAVTCFGRGFGAPRSLLVDANVIALAAGAEHTCALLADGTVRCWGKNDAGQLGDGTFADAPVPVSVSGVNGAVQIAAGARFTCVRNSNRTASCWGDNTFHQLVDGTTTRRPKPVAIHGLFGVEELVAAGDSACARLSDGDVRCWGKNDAGQLGDGTSADHPVPSSIRLPR